MGWACHLHENWLLYSQGDDPQRLGYDYAQAVDLIEKGTMDFMARDSDFMKAKIL